MSRNDESGCEGALMKSPGLHRDTETAGGEKKLPLAQWKDRRVDQLEWNDDDGGNNAGCGFINGVTVGKLW
jgi:hypothetical protein